MASSQTPAQWKPNARSSVYSSVVIVPATRIPAAKHPLQKVIVQNRSTAVNAQQADGKEAVEKDVPKKRENDKPSFFDPLGVAGNMPGSSDAAATNGDHASMDDAATGASYSDMVDDSLRLDTGLKPTGLPSWDSSRYEILEKFTTTEKLLIVSDFLQGGPGAEENSKVKNREDDGSSGKLRDRLEQLDAFDDRAIKRMASVTQDEYIRKIRELRVGLLHAWDTGQRVESIRKAIQAAKLLCDVEPARFYPSKFVLVTDILDTFGGLVYARLFSKASEGAQVSLSAIGVAARREKSNSTRQAQDPLRNITNDAGESLLKEAGDAIPADAKETCRNWFYKVASIRELLPRFYMEVAILKSFAFLDPQAHRAALSRLALMTRGIGNPMVAMYARCYLARVVLLLCPNFKQPLIQSFHDCLIAQHAVVCAGFKDENSVRLAMDSYRPAFAWIIHCIAQGSGEKQLVGLFETFQATMDEQRPDVSDMAIGPDNDEIYDGRWREILTELFLLAVLSHFHAKLVAPRAEKVLEIVKALKFQRSQSNILRKLGNCLVAFEPDCDKMRLLKDAWNVILKFATPELYINAAEAWFHFAACHFSSDQLNLLLSNIIERMNENLAYEDHFPALHAVLSVLLDRVRPFNSLFTLSSFIPFVDMLQKDRVGASSATRIIEGYVAHQSGYSGDVVLAGTLMSLAKKMHDSLNAQSLGDTKQSTAKLLCRFMRKFWFQGDFEQQLSFYVEARGNFGNLDIVLAFLTRAVNSLAMQVKKKAAQNRKSSRKLAGFVRACIAYAYITIPSITNPFHRLPLYLESAQVALQNHSYPQADALVADCIKLLPQLPPRSKIPTFQSKTQSNDPFLSAFIADLLSFLLVVPDNPERGTLFFGRGVIEAIKRYSWASGDNDSIAEAYLSVLVYSCVASGPKLPYHIEGVDSNDRLYGSNPEYLSALNDLAQTALTAYQVHMQSVANNSSDHSHQNERLGRLALNLLHAILTWADVSYEPIVKLAIKLWKIIQKNSCSSLEKRFFWFKCDLNAKEQLTGVDGARFAEFKRRLKES